LRINRQSNGDVMNQNYQIKEGVEDMNFTRIHAWLTASYWVPGIALETVVREARNSALVIGAFAADGTQIAYARVISDRSRMAYLADVVVEEAHRGRGVARAMVQYALDHPELAAVSTWTLATRDAHSVYAPLGFRPITDPQSMPERWMVRRRPKPAPPAMDREEGECRIGASAQAPAPAIRLACAEDLEEINAIYNHYVLHSTSTWQEQPEPIEGRRDWFARHGAAHLVTVAEVDGRIVGWGSLSAYRARSALRYTVENSVYVHHAFHRRGIGSALLRDLITRARALGHHAVIAGIDASQTASIGLHTKFGFEQVGYLREVGLKFGRWLDAVYMELRVSASAPLPDPEAKGHE